MTRLKRFLPYVGGLALIVLLLRQIDPPDVLHLLVGLDLRWLAIGCGWYLLTNGLRAYRFAVLLTMRGWLRPLIMLPEMFALSFLNNVLPARAGELSFPYFLYRRHHVAVGESATVLILARIFDFIAVACLYCAFALLELPNLAVAAARVVGAVAILLLLLTGFLAIAPWLTGRLLGLVRWLVQTNRLAGTRVATHIEQFGQQAFATLARLRHVRTYSLTWVWSLAIWLSTFAWFAAFLRAVGLPERYPLVVVGATFASLAKAIPFITVGGFGAHEAGWTLGFRLTGMATDTAIASGFAVNILTLLVSVVCGGLALIYMAAVDRLRRKNWRDKKPSGAPSTPLT